MMQHHNFTAGGFARISVGIDVAKDKHDCFILNSEGEVLADVFTIPNSMDGFHCLLQRIHDCYGRDMAVEIRDAARDSVGSVMPAKSLELRHTICLIGELDAEIDEIEVAIESIMNAIHSPITTISGIGLRMGAMILAETG